MSEYPQCEKLRDMKPELDGIRNFLLFLSAERPAIAFEDLPFFFLLVIFVSPHAPTIDCLYFC